MHLKKSSSGFTLIELIIAATVLILAGVAGILAEKNYIQSSSLSKHEFEATGAAQEGIAAVKKKFNANLTDETVTDPFAGLGAGNYKLEGGVVTPDPSGAGDTFTKEGITYTRQIIITE